MNISQEQIDLLSTLWHQMVELTYKNILTPHDGHLKQLSFLEISILAFIHKIPDIILKDIIQITNIPNSSLTSLIDRLEKRGYMQRVLSRRDRRSYGLELTELGEQVYQTHLEFEHQLYLSVLQALDTPEERQTFLELLQKVLKKLPEERE